VKVRRYERRLRDVRPIYRRAMVSIASRAALRMAGFLRWVVRSDIGPAARSGKFKVGDIVTRGGDDLQRITEIDDEGYSLAVVCIKAPASGWCALGDREDNLVRRYEFPESARDERA
jgi:hypothetical protein